MHILLDMLRTPNDIDLTIQPIPLVESRTLSSLRMMWLVGVINLESHILRMIILLIQLQHQEIDWLC